jgi:hypothetical protein
MLERCYKPRRLPENSQCWKNVTNLEDYLKTVNVDKMLQTLKIEWDFFEYITF